MPAENCMSSPDINRQPVWKVLYEAALVEFDPKILPWRVDEAKSAIESQLLLTKCLGEKSEDQYLADALSALDQLVRTRSR